MSESIINFEKIKDNKNKNSRLKYILLILSLLIVLILFYYDYVLKGTFGIFVYGNDISFVFWPFLFYIVSYNLFSIKFNDLEEFFFNLSELKEEMKRNNFLVVKYIRKLNDVIDSIISITKIIICYMEKRLIFLRK